MPDAATPNPTRNAVTFEVSWEACSQTGGIYTVLRSKFAAGVELTGDDYYVVGPYRDATARIEFEPDPAPEPIEHAAQVLRDRGVVVRTGRWVITGRPRAILFDLRSVADRLDEFKYLLWRDLGLDSLQADDECDGAVALGWLVADFLQEVRSALGGRAMLAHCHEWQGALAVLLLRHRDAHVPTVFTTHATLVGRSLSAAGMDLYGMLDRVDPGAIAAEHGIARRYAIERAVTNAADVFTTVSEITGREAHAFLGRRQDLVLPNGLNVQRFTAPHEFQNLHRECKERIHEFVMGHFFPSYTFDLSRTLYVFTSGRYEYRNKGMDVFIDALCELNRRLKSDNYGGRVVAFIVTSTPVRAWNVETLNRQVMLSELRNTCEQITEAIGKKLFEFTATGRSPALDELIDDYSRIRLQRMIHAWRHDELPPIVTHDIENDLNDNVLAHLRRVGLTNGPDDHVKVVFHPQFITLTSPALGMEYDQFVRGCNLGVFPSYYEPWGYTPMECIVRGVPAITSDLSGFGHYLIDNFPDHDANGMYVARRQEQPYQNVVYQVAGWLHQLTRMSLRERIQLRNRVEDHADHFDWSRMHRYYKAARDIAVRKAL